MKELDYRGSGLVQYHREMKIKCMLNLCEGGYIYEIIRLVECISF